MLIDAAEQLNFLPVQDCVRIDSFTAQTIDPNSGALSKMSCGNMDIHGVVVRILVYGMLFRLVFSLGRCDRAQKKDRENERYFH